MRIGSLFTGAGALDMAVEKVFYDGHVVWHCENDPHAAKILAHRYPDMPNLGDITRVDWDSVPSVDVLCGGFPCQDVSAAAAGHRKGMQEGTRSALWASYATAIDVLRPRYVVIENVRGLLSAKASRSLEPDDPALDEAILRAAGRVLGDLSNLGYDARWLTLPASAIGAPHKRERVFILAYPGCVGLEGYPQFDVQP